MIGAILGPVVAGLLEGNLMYVFGALGVLGALTSLLLKETQG